MTVYSSFPFFTSRLLKIVLPSVSQLYATFSDSLKAQLLHRLLCLHLLSRSCLDVTEVKHLYVIGECTVSIRSDTLILFPFTPWLSIGAARPRAGARGTLDLLWAGGR